MPTETHNDEADRTLTILMLVDTLQIGGTETHVFSLAKNLMAKGHRVIVGTAGGPYLDTFVDAGIETVHLPFRTDDPLRQELTDLLAHTRRIVAEEGVDVIHAHLIGGMKIATYVAEETGLPFVMTIHGLFYPAWQLQRYLPSCHHVIAVSHPVANWLKDNVGQDRKRMTLIQNGIDTEVFSPGTRDNDFRRELNVAPGDTLILSVGRIAWGKTRVIAATMESLVGLPNNDKIHFAVVGTGPDLPLAHAIASMVNRQLDREVVRFLGAHKSGLTSMYQAADVVIGSARVALEAMSCGRPLIAAGNAGYVGLLAESNLQDAWKVYFGDHTALGPTNSATVAADLSHIIHNAPGLVSFGERGRQWVYDNFNIDSVAARTEAVYRAIVQRNSQSTVQVDDAPFSPSILPLTPQAFTPNANSPLSTKEKSVRPPLTTSKNSRDQTRRPLISVTIPAYNPGDFLDECLNGLFQQSYGPLEIIVVDDASTDHTPTIVREWIKKAKKTDNRTVVYHRLPINVGFAHALSIGYFLATGDFIANHDADDISHHQRIEKQVGFLLKHEDCNMVGTNYEVFSDRVDTRTKSYLVKYGDAVDAAYRQGKHCVCFGSLLFQRRVLERIGGLTSFAQGAEDFEFVARAITQGFKVDNIRQALYYYRAHENQRSREFYSSPEALGDPVSHP